MACESKRISELPGVTRVYPNDLIPIVQDGTNKYITAKDLLGCHDHSGDDCCCSQALSKAITALDFSRTAMDLANKAYDKACLVGTKLAALEEKVAEHDTLICNIRSLITLIFNQLETLKDNLKVTIVVSADTDNKKYQVLQGGRDIETIYVPRPTINLESGTGKPADAYEVWLRLRALKSEVSKNLNFVAGKFTLNGESYNGTTEKTLNIPTRTSHLINDGDPDGNPFLTGVKGYDGRTAPVTDGIADLSRIPIKLDDLSDVDAATPQAGDILYYDGTKWVNTPLQDLVESIIDCEYIQNCVSNFKVTPDHYDKSATETTAEYTVEATGAWTVAKESGDFITNFTPSGNGNGTITVTFGNNTTPNTRKAQFLVTETDTGRTARITINQSGVTPTVDRTITYNISGGQTNSIKVNNEAVSNGGQKTAPDGSNYTASIVSNDPGYKISSVIPSAGTYNTGTGTLTINPITSDVTILVVLEEIPAGIHNVTYVIDGDATKITNLPNSPVTVTNGLSYTFTPTVETGYEIPNNGVTFNPTGNGSYDGTTIKIPLGITTDTTVTIKVVAEGLAVLTVTPTSLEIEPEGTTTPEKISVSTTCTTPGITINTDNLPTGITATLNSAQTEIEVEVASSVAAGDYTFTVSDNCRNTKTVTITKKEEEQVNLFKNVNFSNKKFNAFGVVEERFTNSGQIPLNAGVSDPYDSSTYTNGSMYYQADLGSWRDISDNIDPKLPINLTDALGELLREISEGRLDVNWLKDTPQVRARLSAIKENTNLVYSSNYTLPIIDGNIIKSVPAEYEQKSGATNTYPFYIVIAEDTNSINTSSDLWETHVYVQLWCLPTDFSVSHNENEVEQAHYKWLDTTHYDDKLIGILWEYDNYRMETDAPTGTEREEYKLYLSYRPEHSIDSECDIIYPNGITSKFGITSGFVSNNRDLTVSLNPTIAAFTYSEMNGKTIPNYSVKVYDDNDTLVLNVSYSITLPNNASYELHITFPDNDLLYPLNLVYTMKITANSTNPANYPSLTLTYKVFPTNLGNLTINWTGANPIAEGYLDLAGYYANTEATRNGYYNSTYSNGLPRRAGFSYVGVIPDLISSNNCTITWDRGDGQVITLPVYTSTNRTTEPSDINLERQQYTTDVLTCVNLDTNCPKTGFAIRNTTYYLSSSNNIIEIYIPEVALTTNINVTFN